jgi:hypothetical protein
VVAVECVGHPRGSHVWLALEAPGRRAHPARTARGDVRQGRC